MSLIDVVIQARRDKGGINWSTVDWVLGSLCLGSVIGWLVRFFLTLKEDRGAGAKPLTLKVVVSVMTGGIVLKFLTFWHFQIWAYCIGLLIGIVAYRWIK